MSGGQSWAGALLLILLGVSLLIRTARGQLVRRLFDVFAGDAGAAPAVPSSPAPPPRRVTPTPRQRHPSPRG